MGRDVHGSARLSRRMRNRSRSTIHVVWPVHRPGPRRTSLPAMVASVLLVFVLLACGQSGSGTTTATKRSGVAGPDLSPSDFAPAWSDQQGDQLPSGLGGADAELVVNTVRGPQHCGWQSVTLLHLAYPIGVATSDVGSRRQYVRDPRSVLPDGTVGGRLDVAVRLPADARDTGFRNGDIELWEADSTIENVVYVGRGGRFEAWPRAIAPLACI